MEKHLFLKNTHFPIFHKLLSINSMYFQGKPPSVFKWNLTSDSKIHLDKNNALRIAKLYF